MKAIVSVDNNWGIGSDNQLLFHLPSDMKYFKEKTIGNVVVMGLATYLSLPRQEPLTDRVNIVLCDDPTWSHDGVTVVHNTDELYEELKKYDDDKVFIIGGASIYAQFVPKCETVYITKIDSERDANKFFPNLDEDKNFYMAEASDPIEEKGISFRFTTYKKVK